MGELTWSFKVRCRCDDLQEVFKDKAPPQCAICQSRNRRQGLLDAGYGPTITHMGWLQRTAVDVQRVDDELWVQTWFEEMRELLTGARDMLAILTRCVADAAFRDQCLTVMALSARIDRPSPGSVEGQALELEAMATRPGVRHVPSSTPGADRLVRFAKSQGVAG